MSEPKFKQPFVEKGMLVLWYADTSGVSEASIGVVVEVHDQTIRVSVIAADSLSVTPKNGCRHVKDPALGKQSYDNDSGCWDYTDRDLRLLDLLPELFQPRKPKPATEAAKKAA